MTRDEIILSQIETWIALEINEDFKLKVKEESSLMRFLNFFLKRINKNFMSGYVTTIGSTVYFPAHRFLDPKGMWPTLAHEAYHVWRGKKLTFLLHAFLYLFPLTLIPLILLSLLAIWFSNFWLLNLLWLLCAAPLPAYFRMKEEMEAYIMTMACHWWYGRSISDGLIAHIASKFLKSDYYWMYPFKKAIYKHLERERALIQEGKYDNVFPYSRVREIIQGTENVLSFPPMG